MSRRHRERLAVVGLRERVAHDLPDRVRLLDDVARRPVAERDVDRVDDRDRLERDQEEGAGDEELRRHRSRHQVQDIDHRRDRDERPDRRPLAAVREDDERPDPDRVDEREERDLRRVAHRAREGRDRARGQRPGGRPQFRRWRRGRDCCRCAHDSLVGMQRGGRLDARLASNRGA